MKTFDRISDAIRWMELFGLRVVKAKRSGYWKVYQNERLVGTLSKNMNDARGWKNAITQIRKRAGLERMK